MEVKGTVGERIVALLKAGVPPFKAARMVGVTKDAAYYWRDKAGLATERYRTVDPAVVRAMYADGANDAMIAAAVGCHKRAVGLVRRKLGLPAIGRNRPEFKEAARERAKHLLVYNRLSPEQRSRLYRDNTRRVCERYGLPGDLFRVQVRVVLELANGPLAGDALAVACGRKVPAGQPPGRAFHNRWCRGWNYLADLKARGLLASVRVGRRVFYTLTAECMDLLTRGQRDGQRRDDRRGVAGGPAGGGEDEAAAAGDDGRPDRGGQPGGDGRG